MKTEIIENEDRRAKAIVRRFANGGGVMHIELYCCDEETCAYHRVDVEPGFINDIYFELTR